MALLLRNMTVYTRFNRFKHCAINKEEKHKPMTRTDREAQAQHNDTIQESMAFFIRKIFANVKHASNQMALIVLNIAQYKEEKHKLMTRTDTRNIYHRFLNIAQ